MIAASFCFPHSELLYFYPAHAMQATINNNGQQFPEIILCIYNDSDCEKGCACKGFNFNNKQIVLRSVNPNVI